MSHIILELVLWLLACFAIGLFLGFVLCKLFSAAEELATRPVAVPAPKPPLMPTAPPPPSIIAANLERPKGITAPRDGRPDDLKRISGIGPVNEKILQDLGFFHFDQIAQWSPEQIAWVDDHLRFSGRIMREEWTHQATLLAQGNEEEFARLYGTGGLEQEDGTTQSGIRTRKTQE